MRPKKPLIICGDVNTAHQEIDLARPKENSKKTGFLPMEREWIDGFLAAGLIWSIFTQNNAQEITIFFLSCVTIAGIYGSYSTGKNKIFLIQSVPAIIGIILTLL